MGKIIKFQPQTVAIQKRRGSGTLHTLPAPKVVPLQDRRAA